MGTMWSKQQTVAEKPAISPSRSSARLGSSLQIKGEITGSEDLEIEGIVEGPIWFCLDSCRKVEGVFS